MLRTAVQRVRIDQRLEDVTQGIEVERIELGGRERAGERVQREIARREGEVVAEQEPLDRVGVQG